jgi:hypothetical protein
MFRSTSKKKATLRKIARGDDNDADKTAANQTSTTTDKEEDDDDDHGALQSALLMQKKKKLAKKGRTGGSGLVVRSFNVNEEGVDDIDLNVASSDKRKKKLKRKRGLGFGGGDIGGPLQGGDVDDAVDMQDDNAAETITKSQSYGMEALEKLKAEQTRQKRKLSAPESTPNADAQGSPNLDIESATNPSTSHANFTENSLPAAVPVTEEAFISLHGGDSRHHDTIPYTTQHEDLGEEYDLEEVEVDQEESELWNEQIERRAGIKSSAATATRRSTTTNLVSLDALSDNLQSTIRSMQTQQEQLQNSINRRKADREHANIDSQTQEETLKTAGEACEYYQKLRYDITVWVGALRDLRTKVMPIQQAFLEMLQVQCEDVDHEFRSWQDDSIAVLQEHGMLSQILGRQPKTPTITDAPTVDEFGRDIKSQYIRDRDLRFQKRHQRLFDNVDSPPTLHSICDSLLDDHNEKERCETLNEAFRVALEDLDQDYTSSQSLKDLFDKWKAAYPEDYKQCYASLSLGDLLAIFLQADICKSTWFVDMIVNESEDNESDHTFPKELESMLGEESVDQRKEYLGRSVEKGVLPMLTSILQTNPSILLFLSRKRTQWMSKLVQLSVRNMQESPNLVLELEKVISDALAKVLDGIVIPILNPQDGTVEANQNFAQAERFSSVYLAQMVGEMLSNMVLCWFPLLSLENAEGMNGISAVLSFVNEKFLMLLSSLDKQSTENSTNQSKQVFSAIWQALRKDSRNLLEAPSLLLVTMPLRAAGRAYQLDVVSA